MLLTIAQSTLDCCVCHEPLTRKVFQCSQGAHNICAECKASVQEKCGSLCPICRANGFFPNFQMVRDESDHATALSCS